MKNLLIVSIICLQVLLSMTSSFAQDTPVYKDPNAPVEKRVEDLLARMTLEEKVMQLGGDSSAMATPFNERLGIPALKMSDGPHGARWDQSTCFPGLLAMGATWDAALVEEMGSALGREFRGKGRYIALGPCINIIRDPRGGRSFETFGEDPYLTSILTVAYVEGMQAEKCAATLKHFAANNQENGRGDNNVEVSERVLRETYLPHFEAGVNAGAWAVMGAYNKVNGFWCCENVHLLRDILKGEWGFQGIVMSDWGATHGTESYLNGGLDVEMPFASFYGDNLLKAVKEGKVSEAYIDDAARRVLRVKFLAGEFDNPVQIDESQVNTPAHQALELKCATESIVLLKNDGNLLPLDLNKIDRIAMIGPNAAEARQSGGGSAYITPYYTINPLQGLQDRIGDKAEIEYVRGCGLTGLEDAAPIPQDFVHVPGDPATKGWQAEYWNNMNFEGEPVIRRIDPTIAFNWGWIRPMPEINEEKFTVRWKGILTPPITGKYQLAITSDDGMRIFIDGKQVLESWHDHAVETSSTMFEFTGGQEYSVQVEFYENSGDAQARLTWERPDAPTMPFAEAREAARKADVAIVCVGSSAGIESEGVDRKTLALPGRQNDLIKAVTEENPNTIVVMISGSAMLMDNWLGEVQSVIQAWFSGQEAGNAIADVLLGNANPGGKLPLSWPVSDEQLAPFNNTYETMEVGHGYWRYDKLGMKPQFCFGYGLSYTTFEYSDLKLPAGKVKIGEPVKVSFTIKNTGNRAGSEVAQLYVRDVSCSMARPLRQLKGFTKVQLQPGEARQVELTLTERDFAFYDDNKGQWIVEPGYFDINIGASSRDIRLVGSLEMQ